MRLGHCWECHSATSTGPREVGEEGFLSGSDHADEFPGRGQGLLPQPHARSETGLGKYSAEQIKQAIRNGKRLDGKRMAAPMSLFTPHISGLADEDLDALVAFMKSVPPVKNKIPDRQLDPSYEKKLEAQ
jgi:mono/diheme cytochrome c family protein